MTLRALKCQTDIALAKNKNKFQNGMSCIIAVRVRLGVPDLCFYLANGLLIFCPVLMIRIYLPQNDLPETHDAETVLSSFCDWSNKINPPSEYHPQHHDIAILLTRWA